LKIIEKNGFKTLDEGELAALEPFHDMKG